MLARVYLDAIQCSCNPTFSWTSCCSPTSRTLDLLIESDVMLRGRNCLPFPCEASLISLCFKILVFCVYDLIQVRAFSLTLHICCLCLPLWRRWMSAQHFMLCCDIMSCMLYSGYLDRLTLHVADAQCLHFSRILLHPIIFICIGYLYGKIWFEVVMSLYYVLFYDFRSRPSILNVYLLTKASECRIILPHATNGWSMTDSVCALLFPCVSASRIHYASLHSLYYEISRLSRLTCRPFLCSVPASRFCYALKRVWIPLMHGHSDLETGLQSLDVISQLCHA